MYASSDLVQATFVTASPSDLLWLDQSDLIAVIDEHPDIKGCLEKTASTDQHVSLTRQSLVVPLSRGWYFLSPWLPE